MIAMTTPITAQVSRKTPINTIVFAGASGSEVGVLVFAGRCAGYRGSMCRLSRVDAPAIAGQGRPLEGREGGHRRSGVGDETRAVESLRWWHGVPLHESLEAP